MILSCCTSEHDPRNEMERNTRTPAGPPEPGSSDSSSQYGNLYTQTLSYARLQIHTHRHTHTPSTLLQGDSGSLKANSVSGTLALTPGLGCLSPSSSQGKAQS